MAEEQSNSLESTKGAPEKAEEQIKPEQATILDDEFRNLPPEVTLMISQSSRYMGPVPNPIAAKVNERHIDVILDHSEKDSDREYKASIHQKYFNAFLVFAAIGLVVFLTVFLAKDNSDLYKYILTAFLSFLGGFGGGYGYKSAKKE